MILQISLFANFTVFGVAFTFGVFPESYRADGGPLYYANPAAVAIIGTLAFSVTYLGGTFQSKIRKHMSATVLMGIGSLMLSLGLILACFCINT